MSARRANERVDNCFVLVYSALNPCGAKSVPEPEKLAIHPGKDRKEVTDVDGDEEYQAVDTCDNQNRGPYRRAHAYVHRFNPYAYPRKW